MSIIHTLSYGPECALSDLESQDTSIIRTLVIHLKVPIIHRYIVGVRTTLLRGFTTLMDVHLNHYCRFILGHSGILFFYS